MAYCTRIYTITYTNFPQNVLYTVIFKTKYPASQTSSFKGALLWDDLDQDQ